MDEKGAELSSKGGFEKRGTMEGGVQGLKEEKSEQKHGCIK